MMKNPSTFSRRKTILKKADLLRVIKMLKGQPKPTRIFTLPSTLWGFRFLYGNLEIRDDERAILQNITS
jgi:hypothetical protein